MKHNKQHISSKKIRNMGEEHEGGYASTSDEHRRQGDSFIRVITTTGCPCQPIESSPVYLQGFKTPPSLVITSYSQRIPTSYLSTLTARGSTTHRTEQSHDPPPTLTGQEVTTSEANKPGEPPSPW
ncbi:hypothetical protein N665_7578s0001 [Sinapis alba]|nr:hypothetical protein N665_7578s0001 [Sinapis alba]